MKEKRSFIAIRTGLSFKSRIALVIRPDGTLRDPDLSYYITGANCQPTAEQVCIWEEISPQELVLAWSRQEGFLVESISDPVTDAQLTTARSWRYQIGMLCDQSIDWADDHSWMYARCSDTG